MGSFGYRDLAGSTVLRAINHLSSCFGLRSRTACAADGPEVKGRGAVHTAERSFGRLGKRCAQATAVALMGLTATVALAGPAPSAAAHFQYARKTASLPVAWAIAADAQGNVYSIGPVDSGSTVAIWKKAVNCESAGCVQVLVTNIEQTFPYIAPSSMAVDAGGNLYIASNDDAKIYKVPAGCTSASCFVSLGGGFIVPLGIGLDGQGNIFLGDRFLIEKLPVGCVSSSCVSQLDIYSTGAPYQFVADAAGNVFVAATNGVFKIPVGCTSDTCIVPLGGGFTRVQGIALDGTTLYVTDTAYSSHGTTYVKSMDVACASANCVSKLWATSTNPFQLAIDTKHNLYATNVDEITELMTGSARFEDTNVGASNTLSLQFVIDSAGLLEAPVVLTGGAAGLEFSDAGTGTCTTNGTSKLYSAGDTCTVDVKFTPLYAGQRLGAVQLKDGSGAVIATARMAAKGMAPQVSFTPGVVTTVAGSGAATSTGCAANTDACGDGGAATAAVIAGPQSVVIDGAGNLYMTDLSHYRIRKVSAVDGTITTVVGTGDSCNNTTAACGDGGPATAASLADVLGLALDANGDLYLADASMRKVRKVTAATGIITTVAGTGIGCSTTGGCGNGGLATAANLSVPGGVEIDGAGNLYIADYGTRTIRKVAVGTGIITTVAGTGGNCTSGSCGDGGQATSATFNLPIGVRLDSVGDLYIADYGISRVRKITMDSGKISTVAGTGVACTGSAQASCGEGGPATSAQLTRPWGVSLDAAGNLYIAETGNNRIHKVAVDGTFTRIAGTGTFCSDAATCADGAAATSTNVASPTDVAIDRAGNIYFADTDTNRVRRISAGAAPVNFATATTPGTTDTTDGVASVLLNNIGNTTLTFAVPGAVGALNPSISADFIYNAGSTCTQVGSSGTAMTLPAGASCSEKVQFAPTQAGTIVGSVVTKNNALNAAGARQSVSLSGTGLALEPVLAVTSSHADPLKQGQLNANFAIAVSNTGSMPTSGTVTAVITPPSGITVTSLTGSADWNCTLATLTCTRSTSIATGSTTYLAMVGDVSATAGNSSNVVTVSGGGATSSATVTDTVNVTARQISFVVNSTGSSAAANGCNAGNANTCTLRQAIAQAVALGNNVASTITFDPSTFSSAKTIATGGTELAAVVGPNASLTITGPGKDSSGNYLATIDGESTSRIFNFTPSTGTITVSDLALYRGAATGSGTNASGGCIYGTGPLKLSRMKLDSCTVVVSGSGLAQGGAVALLGTALYTIDTVAFTNNSTMGPTGQGGAVLSTGSLVLKSSTLSNNTAMSTGASTGGGGGVYSIGAMSVSDTVFDSNVAQNTGTGAAIGGAVFASGGLTMSGSTLQSNRAVAISSSAIGGGLYLSGSTSNLDGTTSANTITKNTAKMAGGIYAASATLTMLKAKVTQNSATNGAGGGIYSANGTLNVANVEVSGNTATSVGAGVFKNFGSLTLNNVSIYGNSSAANGVGLYASTNSAATLDLTNVTIAENRGAYPTGFYLLNNAIGALNISNSTFVNNIVTNGSQSADFGCAADTTIPGIRSSNVIGSASTCGLVGESTALMSAVGDYGGSLPTVLPLPGSSAIGSGTCTAGTDIRGYARPAGACDRGAVQTSYSATWSTQPSSTVSPAADFSAAVTLKEHGNALWFPISQTMSLPVTLTTNGGGSLTGSPLTSISISGVATGTFQVSSAASNNALSVALSGATVSSNSFAVVSPQVAQTINFTQPTTPVVNGVAPMTLSATATSGLTVTFTVVSGNATVNGNTLTITGAGNVVVQADQAGSSGYFAAAPVQRTITVTARANAYQAADVNVGSSGSTETAWITFATATKTGSEDFPFTSAVTQGVPDLDFKLATGGTCAPDTNYAAGQSCSVKYTFNPTAPGLRIGAIRVLNSSYVVAGTAYISGKGIGPLATFVPGNVTVQAGNGDSEYHSGDDGKSAVTVGASAYGIASSADGAVYIADYLNNRVRVVGQGKIFTLAGTGVAANTGDGGDSRSASVNGPGAIAVDGAGVVYFSATNRIRKYDSANATISTVAGGGANAASCAGSVNSKGDGCLATEAELSNLNDIHTDAAGNLYLTDGGRKALRKIDSRTGIISTVAGGVASQQVCSAATDSFGSGCLATETYLNPQSVTSDAAGNLYVADGTTNVVFKIAAGTGVLSRVAGGGSDTSGADGLLATSVSLNVYRMTTDPAGNLLLTDVSAGRLLKVNLSTGRIYTVAGGGSGDAPAAANSIFLGAPVSVSVDPKDGAIFIADALSSKILKLSATPADVKFATATPAGTKDAADGNQVVTMWNSGTAALSLKADVAVPTSFALESATTCPSTSGGTLNAGSFCKYAFSFTPQAATTYSSTLNLVTNNRNEASAITLLQLGGVGSTPTPTVTVAAKSASFGAATTTLTASIAYTLSSAPTGTVYVEVDGGDIVAATCTGTTSPLSCSTVYNTSSLTAGDHTIVITILADGNYKLSSNRGTLTINASVPAAPTNVSATAGNGKATVSFSAPSSNGGAAITSYTVTSNPGGVTASGTASPLTVTGLTNGVAYTFTVAATNSAGTSSASAASNSVTPIAPPVASSFTFGSIVAYNPGGADPMFLDVSFMVTNSPTSYAVVSGTTSRGGSVSIDNTGGVRYTPAEGARGNDTFQYTATNASGTSAAATVTIVVGDPTFFAIVPSINATVGTAYNSAAAAMQFEGGKAPYTITGVSGLPNGLSLNNATGVISGTPTATCTCTVTFTVKDSSSSPYTGTVNATIKVAAGAPGAPTIGTATAGDAQATVTFVAPAATNGAAITGYTVTSSPGGITASGTASPITITGLTNGTAYTFTVKATNSAGSSAASAASNSVTPQGSQTITFNNPAAQNFGTTPTLTATASSSLAVTFTSNTPAVCTITAGGSLTFVSSGTCTIKVEQAGNAAYTAATAVTRSFNVNAVAPGAPTIGTATGGNAQATVAFTAPASNGGVPITGYTVTALPGGAQATGSGSPLTVTGLTNGVAYTFTVTATNSAGTSSPSAASNSVTPLDPTPVASSFTYGTAIAYNQASAAATTINVASHVTNSPTAFAVVSATSAHGGTVSINSSGIASYTPPVGFRGSDSFQFTASNTSGTSAAATVTVSVADPTITAALPSASATAGSAYNSSAAASVFNGGHGPYTVTGISGLPAGLTSNGAVISGTPTATCTCTVTISVTDSSSPSGFSTTIDKALNVSAGVPAVPANVSATAGDASATVTFTAPAANGASITGYTVTSSGGHTVTAAASPITITGLTNGTAYTFTVAAINSVGTGSASAASNSVTPQGTQTITFSNPGSQTFGTSPTLTASASSNLAVAFSSLTPSICTITNGGALTLVSTGTCTIQADQAGDAAFKPATAVTRSFSVVAASQTISFKAPSSPVVYGAAPVTLSATASSGLGVSFSVVSGPGSLNSNVLSFTGAGTVVVAANQAGDTNYSAATEVQRTIVVDKATPTLAWTSPADITYGTALSAAQLNASASGVGATAINGTFTYTPAAGTLLAAGNGQILKVDFVPADPTNYNTVSKTVTINVTSAAQTISFAGPASPIVYGSTATVALSATGGASTSPLTFTVAGPATLNGSTLSINGAGQVTITASQAGDSNYAAAVPVVRTLIVNKASATASATTTANSVPYGQATSVTFAVAGQFSGAGVAAPTGSVQYSIVNAAQNSVASGTLAVASGVVTVPMPSTLPAGAYTVNATYAGDANYNASTLATAAVSVGQIQPSISWAQPASITYGTSLAGLLNASALNGITAVQGSYVYLNGTTAITAATVLPAGSYTLTVNFTPADAVNYKAATQTVPLIVNKGNAAVAVTTNKAQSFVQNAVVFTAVVNSTAGATTGSVSFYDGTPATVIGTAPLNGGVATLSISTLAAGTHNVGAVYSGDSNFNTAGSASTAAVTLQDFKLDFTTGSGSGSVTSPTTQTVLPGGTAVYTFNIAPTGTTFPADLNIAVSGLPSGFTATVTPSTIPAGTPITAVKVTVTAPRTVAAAKAIGGLAPVAFALLLLPFSRRMRKAGRKLGSVAGIALLLVISIAGLCGLTGCGAGGGGYFATPKKTVTFTVTATSGTLSHSTTLTLDVL